MISDKSTNLKVLITGGSGFIGSNLIKYFLSKTCWKILNIDKILSKTNDKSFAKHKNRYQFTKLNLNNFKKLKKIYFEFKPNFIIHLAAESHVDNSIIDSKKFINSNIISTYNLLEISRAYIQKKNKLNKNFFFYYISTDEVYGENLTKTKNLEVSTFNPSSPYSATKASSEHLVRAWSRTYNIPYIISRSSNNYGPKQHKEKLIPKIIYNSLNSIKIPVYGKGKQIRNWLYVYDHIKIIHKIILSNKRNKIYNIPGNDYVTNIKIIKKIMNLIQSKKINNLKKIDLYKLISFVKDRPGHDYIYFISGKKLINEIGEINYTKLEDGLEQTINSYLNKKK